MLNLVKSLILNLRKSSDPKQMLFHLSITIKEVSQKHSAACLGLLPPCPGAFILQAQIAKITH